MKLLLDTHILLWAAGQPEKLSAATRSVLLSDEHQLYFSAAAIWEIVIKLNLGRDDFRVDPHRLRKGLVLNGYTELPVTAEHALQVDSLPVLHKDPFDRLLLAQARVEGMRLVTVDATVAQYGEPVLTL
jgi:PIN domain nuclease of toxin-antitoxin system